MTAGGPGFQPGYRSSSALAAPVSAGDIFASTHRAHAHTLARGTHPNAVMAELYGKVEGCSHGYGGSMHLYDVALAKYRHDATAAKKMSGEQFGSAESEAEIAAWTVVSNVLLNLDEAVTRR